MRSLDGRRILVTRSRSQASALSAQLEAEGATTISVPTIEIVSPADYGELDKALSSLDDFEWVLFTSANAVEVFAARRLPDVLPHRIAAIGPATARAIEALGLRVDLVPPRYVAESFAEALLPHTAGKSVLLIRAEEARDVLPDALIASGAKLTIAVAYRNQIPASSILSIRELFSAPQSYPDVITLTSASTARSLFTMLDKAKLSLPSQIALASIGPITTAAIRERGYEVAIEAEEATLPALVKVIVRHFTSYAG